MNDSLRLERCPMCDTPAARPVRALRAMVYGIAIFLMTMLGVTVGCGLLWMAVEIVRATWR